VARPVSSGLIKNTQTEAIVRAAPPTIYDVARIAGVATSTVSRALSNPGRVSFKTAEHVRKVAEEIGYRSAPLERALPVQRTMLLGMIVADINNPVFHGMIRGAERTAMHAGYIMLVVETQESVHTEKQALSRVLSAVDGVILSSSRMPDASIRDAAKHRPLVLLNRTSPGSAAVNRPLKRSWHQEAELAEPVLLPTRLVVRDPTGRKRNR
jgi:LacI family transcriptional regulator, repressor for deo operon, udp, cdd, tsx, nupC, and nupG